MKTRNVYWIGCWGTLIADQRVYDISDNMQSLGAEKPANATQQGIDVSSHQGKIDWEQVKNSALADYAIIRCGYGVNQTDKDDKYWDYNSSECERLGIPYGTYLYSGADTTAKAKAKQNMSSDFYRKEFNISDLL